MRSARPREHDDDDRNDGIDENSIIIDRSATSARGVHA